jgi:hypothetical protein
MARNVDPHLMKQIEQAGEDGEVEALLLLEDDGKAAAAGEAESTGARLISRVSEQLHEQPSVVKQMPRLGAMYVKGSGKLVRELVESDEVLSASSNEAEVYPIGKASKAGEDVTAYDAGSATTVAEAMPAKPRARRRRATTVE